MTNMGLGRLNFKQKMRWVFEAHDEMGRTILSRDFVKVSSRPHIVIQETELHYANSTSFIPGRSSWETIGFTWCGANQAVRDQLETLTLKQMEDSSKKFPRFTGILWLYGGVGQVLEVWKLESCFVQACQFEDTYPDESYVELTIRYNKAEFSNNPSIEWLGGRCAPIRQLLGIVT